MYIKSKPISLLQLNKLKQEKVEEHLKEYNENNSYIVQKVNLDQNYLEQNNSIVRLNLIEPIINKLKITNVSDEFSDSSNVDGLLNAESVNKYFSSFTLTNTSSAEIQSIKTPLIETPLANKTVDKWNNDFLQQQLDERLKKSFIKVNANINIQPFLEESEEKDFTIKNPINYVLAKEDEIIINNKLEDFKSSKKKLKDLTDNFFIQEVEFSENSGLLQLKALPTVSELSESSQVSDYKLDSQKYIESLDIEEQRKIFSQMAQCPISKKRKSIEIYSNHESFLLK